MTGIQGAEVSRLGFQDSGSRVQSFVIRFSGWGLGATPEVVELCRRNGCVGRKCGSKQPVLELVRLVWPTRSSNEVPLCVVFCTTTPKP